MSDAEHRTTVQGHDQHNGGRQWLASCTCGWSEWNVHPHGAQAWAHEHEQEHAHH